MKLPNGFGSITKLGGNRRKPWCVRAACRYSVENDKVKEKREIIGCFSTKKEALNFLAGYNDRPDLNGVTLLDVYGRWKSDTRSAPYTLKIYDSLFRKLSEIEQKPLCEIRLSHLDPIFKAQTPSVQRKLRTLLRNIYRYAIRYEIVQKDYSALIETSEYCAKTKTVFTDEEIETLWKSEGLVRDILLIMIYSGWRIGEIIRLRNEDIDIEDRTMKGGIKTKAGIGRTVPIHPAIVELIEKYYDPTMPLLFELDYKRIYREIKKLTGHTPHETRHTFMTLMHRFKADPICVKKLAGHSISDVTYSTYTHVTIDDLRTAIGVLPTCFH